MEYDSYSSVRRTDKSPVVISSGPLASLVDTSTISINNPSYHDQNTVYPLETSKKSSLDASKGGLVSSSSGWEFKDFSSSTHGRDGPQDVVTSEGLSLIDGPVDPVPSYTVIGNLEQDSSLVHPTTVGLSNDFTGPATDAEVMALLAEFPMMIPTTDHTTTTTTTTDPVMSYRSPDHQDSVGMPYTTQVNSLNLSLQNTHTTSSSTPPDFGMTLGTNARSLSSSTKSTCSTDHQSIRDDNFLGISDSRNSSSYIHSVDLNSGCTPESLSSQDWRLSKNTFDPGSVPTTSNNGVQNGLNDLLGMNRGLDETLVSFSSGLWEPSLAVSPSLSLGATSSLNESTSGGNGLGDDWNNLRRESWEDKELFGNSFNLNSNGENWNYGVNDCSGGYVVDKAFEDSKKFRSFGLDDFVGSGESSWDSHCQFWKTLDEA